MADLPAGYAFTLCKVADFGRLASKRFVGKTDGSYEKFDYDHVTRWFFAPKTVSGNSGMAALLRKLAQRREIMLVMGGVRPGLDLWQSQLRRWADMSPTKNTLVSRDRAWLAIDVDGYGVPAPWGLAAHLADAARCVRDDALGEEFAGVECVVTATSSTGLVGEDEARMRLFFMLSEPYAIPDLARWAKGARAVGLPVDPAIFQPGQPIYTARPRFEAALSDPLQEGLTAFVLPAAAGCGDRVTLDVHCYDRRMKEIVADVGRVAGGCGGDWRKLLTETLGGPTSFFEPLSQVLGLAARLSDSDAEIVLFVEALLAEKADHGRQKQYAERWVLSTLKRFRQRDAQVADDLAQLRAGMFREAVP